METGEFKPVERVRVLDNSDTHFLMINVLLMCIVD